MNKPKGNKKIQTLYHETGRLKVASVLFDYPEKEFSLSELAKEAGVAKANIGSILDELLDAEFITLKKLSKIWRIQANQTNTHFVKSKIIYNLSKIYDSSLDEFLNQHFKNPRAIIVFGSFRKGEDLSTSDIDIAIEDTSFKDYAVRFLPELAEYEQHFNGRKIQVHTFNKDIIGEDQLNSMANGIVLLGYLQTT
tara:strand:- start:799 stop:1383 length:585 start_codon:yes stop_codon:yes gene_type:complete